MGNSREVHVKATNSSKRGRKQAGVEKRGQGAAVARRLDLATQGSGWAGLAGETAGPASAELRAEVLLAAEPKAKVDLPHRRRR